MPRYLTMVVLGAAAGCDHSQSGGVCDLVDVPKVSSAECAVVEATARTALAAAVAANVSCTSDADCVYFDRFPCCAVGCYGSAVATASLERMNAAVDHIEQTICVPGCAQTYPPCPMVPALAACLSGSCVYPPPQK